jgi:phage tail-like protein
VPQLHPGPDTKIGLGFLFLVEFDGQMAGAFTECSAPSVTVAVDKWEEGGVNDRSHQMPARTEHGNVTLKQAVYADKALHEWLLKVSTGKGERKPLSIIVTDGKGETVRRWNFDGAFPVKWTGPEMKVDSNNAAIESFEFAHEGLL